MGWDIRIPIGQIFLILGILLAGYGLVSDKGLYQRSLGYNVNLWWGLLLLVFGATMYYFGRKSSREQRDQPAPRPQEEQRPVRGH